LLTIQKQRDDALAVVAQKYDVELSTNSKNLKNEQLNLSSTTQKLNSAKVEMNAATNALNKCAEEIMQFEATLGSLRITVENNTKDIKAISESLTNSYGELEEKQMSLEVLTKFETILKRDFRGFLLSNIIEFISKRAKEYCKVIFDTDKIGFYLDGNNIEIDYLDKAYENLSGGERQKIDLIVQFSIRDMLCGYLGFTSNILVLDEVFDGLDMIGCQRVLDVISSISDIKNIFIVTHRRDLSVPTDKEITVVKSSDGISELRC
jgi:DNA repair exonuclease SbcCD ATPase subunit